MSVDIFNFLQMLKESSPIEIDPVQHTKEHQKQRDANTERISNKDIEDQHIHRIRKALSKFKTEVEDCTKELGPDEFRFCGPQSGKKDLEVSHKHPKGKTHKILKIELKGKKAGGRTEASQYGIPLDKELEVPHYDHEGNPVLDSKGTHQTTKFTPRDYLTGNPTPTNVSDCLKKCTQKNPAKKQECEDKCNKKIGRTDAWNPSATQPGEASDKMSRFEAIFSRVPGTRKLKQWWEARKQALLEKRKKGLHHTIQRALPHLLASTGTHATISGNDDDITVIHHQHGGDENGKGRHADRDELEHLFGQMGLQATHEPHEISGTSGSPHITYPDADDRRGSHAMLRITHKHSTEEQKQKAKQNAETLKK